VDRALAPRADGPGEAGDAPDRPLGDREVALPLGEAFHSRRLRILGSQVGAVAPLARPRWSHARRLAKALELLRDPALDRLISGDVPFASLPEVIPRLAADPAGVLCQRVSYPGA
jgi:hypothetical protein